MKDVAFIILLVLAVMLLIALTLIQAASLSLKVTLFISILMGMVTSLIVAMIAFTVDETVNMDSIYKILFISQLASGFISVMLTMQPCFAPALWQRRIAMGLQNFLDSISGDRSFEKSMLHSLQTSESQSRFATRSMIVDKSINRNSCDFGHINRASGGMNLANVSYNESSSDQLLRGASHQKTVEQIFTPFKEVFFITDMVVINKALAGKLEKCNLEGTTIMVRSGKEKIYDSSEQVQIGQTHIMGFLSVDRLVQVCRSSQASGKKIWQHIKAGDLSYQPVLYVRADQLAREAYKQMNKQNIEHAVVKKGQREVGMVYAHKLRQEFTQESIELPQEESKDQSYMEYLQQKLPSWKSLVGENSRDSSGILQNRISKDQFGNELSRISRNADQLSSLDSLDRDDIESCQLNVIGNTSIVRTEASQKDHSEEFKEMYQDQLYKGGQQNRLAQSERVRTSSKSSTYFNYLNNRKSVRIKIGAGQDRSLAQRLLGGISNNQISEEPGGDSEFGDLANPLLDPNQL